LTNDKPKESRRKLGLPHDKCIVLFVAPHLFFEKGVYELVKAAAAILRERNDIYFVIVGSGGEEVNIKAYCRKYNLNRNIRLMGTVPHKTVLQLMIATDILILPSHREQLPMVILEAMAAGLPVIATNVGAIPEIIVNKKNGLIVNPKDYRALKNGIEFLADNPKLCKEISKKNAISIKTNYDLKIAIKPFESTYQQLLSE
jgi:glycosyltransferase involved in cell wall biosynthesis